MLCHNFNGALSHRLGLLGPTVGTIFAADNKFVISFLIFYENKARFFIVDLHTDAKGSLTVWALYAYFSDSQNAAFELLVWCM